MKKTFINIFVVLGLLTSSFLGAFSGEKGFAAENSEELNDRGLILPDQQLDSITGGSYVPGEVIITLAEGVNLDSSARNAIGRFGIDALDQFNTRKGLESMRPLVSTGQAIQSSKGGAYAFMKSYVLQFPVGVLVPELVRELGALEEIAFAEPNYIYHLTGDDEPTGVDATPNDPLFGSQGYLGTINAETAWNTTTGSATVTIALVDSGVDYTHVDLDGRVDLGYDYVNDDADPLDDNGHGTQMAGIIAAETNNGIGVAGVDWNARLLAIKVSDDTGSVTSDNLINGINYAVDNGADIINISIGSSTGSFLVESAVNYAYDNDVTVIASAGNDGENAEYFPASFDHVMSVAAVGSTGRKTTTSNYHISVDLNAPGTNVYTTIMGGTYDNSSGTSAATAIVSGVAGLVKAIHPTWTPDEVMGQIAGSSYDNLGVNSAYPNQMGAGRVDAAGAVGPEAVGPIAYAGFEVDDPNGDGDGLASPGDLIELNVLIKTYDDLTTGAFGTLTTADAYFVCGTNVITYTDMAFGVITPSSPLACTISESAPVGHLATFNFTGDGGVSGTVNESFQIEIHPDPKDGWPVSLGLGSISSPSLYDLDGTGQDEIFLTSLEGSLKIWDATGTELSGWPRGGTTTFGSPAIADMDRDGADEIVLPGYVYEADGSNMVGWPQEVPLNGTCGFITAAPAVGDVTGDGFLNIVFGSWDQYLHVYNMDGSTAAGFPMPIGASVTTAVALANLDSDVALEIIVSTNPQLLDFCGSTDAGGIHVLNGDGTYLPGWPQLGNPTGSSPSVGDIDGDGALEIVAADYAFEINGTMVTGFPKLQIQTVTDSPALANISGNAALEIVIASNPLLIGESKVYVLDGSGANLPGWPVTPGFKVSSAPMVADLDGNGSLEIIVTTAGSRVYAWDSTGNLVAGFPIVMGDGIEELPMSSSPAIGDVEGDGRVDIFVPGSGGFYAWEMAIGSYDPGGMPWSQYNHDVWNTGTYGFVPTSSEGAITINNYDDATFSSSVTLTLSAPGATQMMISNSANFLGGTWVAYATELPWTISSGVGSRTVYAKFRYPDTHESTVVFDSIFLDETIPSVQITSPDQGDNFLARRQIPVFGTATDDNFVRYESSFGMGLSPTTWSFMGAGPGPVPTPTQVGTFWTDNADDGAVTLRLIGEDIGGNQGEDTISIDLGRIRDVSGTLTPAQVVPGQVTNFEVQVTNPVANDLNLSTETIFWLNDFNPENATKVPPYNPTGPFPTYEIPSSGAWYAQTFTVAETFLLTRVGLPISFGLGVDLTLEIRPLDGSGLPTLPPLATATGSALALGEETEMLFDNIDCWMQAGESYGVVLKPTAALSYLLLTDDTGALPGTAYKYTISTDSEWEDWIAQTYDFPLNLYKALAYSAHLTTPTLLPSLGTASLTFGTSTIPLGFGPAAYTPTITYEGVEGTSDAFFTFTESDVNHVALIGDPPTMTVSDVTITEPITGTSQAVFRVNLSGPSYYNVTVDYSTAGVEATDGLDFQGTSGTLTILSGKRYGEIRVTILEDDLIEGTETFNLDLTNPGYANLSDTQAVGTIIDTDLPFQVSVLDSLMLEGDVGGTYQMPFIIYLTEPISDTVTVDYATVDGTATAGIDYLQITGTATITPGSTFDIILVDIIGDVLDEPNETFSLQLSNPTNAPIGDDVGVGTILDDDITYQIFLPVVFQDAGSGLKVIGKTSISKNPDVFSSLLVPSKQFITFANQAQIHRLDQRRQ